MADGYTKFRAMANRNAAMSAVPTPSMLDDCGVTIDSRGYMHFLGMQWNPGSVNPEILPEVLQPLFMDLDELADRFEARKEARKNKEESEPTQRGTPDEYGVPDSLPELPGSEENRTEENLPEQRICDECKQPLPLSDFRKYRGGSHDNVCKSCKKEMKKKERKKFAEETTPPDSQQKQTANGWISKQRVKELVSEAYSRGYSDGQADALPEEEDVTLDELLEVADEQA